MNRNHSLRVGALLLTGTLALSTLPAQAAGYTDLSPTHWAYAQMTRAVGLGIINGVGSNQMAPARTLSWGEFLAMAARTFAPDAYQQALDQGAAWDLAGYSAAAEAGLLRAKDGLRVTPGSLGSGISREDAAVLLYRALPEETQEEYAEQARRLGGSGPFTDFDQMDQVHQAAVCALSDLSISNGKPDGSFGRSDQIQRCDGTVLLMRTLEVVDRQREGEPMSIVLQAVDSQSGQVLSTLRCDAEIGQGLYSLREEDPPYYVFEGFGEITTVSSACTVYTLNYRPMTQAEREEESFWEQVDDGLASFDDYWTQPFWLVELGENPAKCQLLFGSADKRRFDSQAEAAAAMTTITVPVWTLSGGVKKPSTTTLQVHSAIADDVKEIFTEIYNDPEQFPINATSTFRYVEGTTGEHNCGTAIDLNANENYQIRDGQILVGTCWEPGVNPYSIAPGSSVVRIFAEHGWSWGGDAWAADSDDSTGYHDYMHFSYMGG